MTILLKGITTAFFVGLISVFMTADVFQECREDVIRFIHSLIGEFGTKTVSLSNEKHKNMPYDVVSKSGDMLYVKEDLAKYDGSDGSPGLYLAILGRVYDVKAGEKHYDANGGYGFFRARDGTRAFMTGEFNDKGLIDDVVGLSSAEMLELENWIKFYDKTYTYKGKLVGNFYDEEGNPTKALHAAVEAINEAHAKKRADDIEKRRMPPCNSEAKQGKRRVWCSNKSGGIHRDWVGVPRQLYKSGSTHPQCVCVNDNDLDNPQLKLYEKCDSKAKSCQLGPTKPKK